MRWSSGAATRTRPERSPKVWGDGRPLAVPIAADDRAAADVVGKLVRLVGGGPVDDGVLEQARNLEAMAAIVIRLLFGGAPETTVFNLVRGDREPTA